MNILFSQSQFNQVAFKARDPRKLLDEYIKIASKEYTGPLEAAARLGHFDPIKDDAIKQLEELKGKVKFTATKYNIDKAINYIKNPASRKLK